MDTLVTEMIAAATGGCVATLLGHPLDCIKVQMQTMQSKRSTIGCAAEMLQTNGPSAFFRGAGPPLMNSILMNTIMFVAFEEARRHMPDSTVGSLCAGGLSGIITSLLSTPTDWVKVQAQTRNVPVRKVVEMLRKQPLGDAFRSLFTGQTMNMLREGIFTAVYLGLYTQLRAAFVPPELDGGSGGVPPLHLVAAASATTGALAWVSAYPFDSVKSMQQAQYAGGRLSPADAASRLWARGGPLAFYRGVSASTTRAMLVTSSRLFTYEAIKGWLR